MLSWTIQLLLFITVMKMTIFLTFCYENGQKKMLCMGNHVIHEADAVILNLEKSDEDLSHKQNELWEMYFDGSRN